MKETVRDGGDGELMKRRAGRKGAVVTDGQFSSEGCHDAMKRMKHVKASI